ncbi:hypothetical protein HPB50_021436 [Hyalomma asiaticum]|uniref:Uncharacterized protein n=1 Tax=Hyalomma asiaticum TaxID=266040 RepID=A0ACB7TNV2_HYAAI|nr:hypothetical protein HPB50_021436 [Hyalomma asiaticum]
MGGYWLGQASPEGYREITARRIYQAPADKSTESLVTSRSSRLTLTSNTLAFCSKMNDGGTLYTFPSVGPAIMRVSSSHATYSSRSDALLRALGPRQGNRSLAVSVQRARSTRQERLVC